MLPTAAGVPDVRPPENRTRHHAWRRRLAFVAVCTRGSATSVYDYAHFGERLVVNKSFSQMLKAEGPQLVIAESQLHQCPDALASLLLFL